MTTSPAASRRATAIVLIVLASLIAYLAIFAIWLNRQALNTDNWTRTSSEVLEQPVVRDQLAARLTDELFRSVDVEAAVRDVLPPRAEPLAGPAANALRDQVEKSARKALARPDVQATWADANRAAHVQLLAVLEGGGTTVSTSEGKVVLDVRALLGELQQRVGVGGRLRKVLPASATQITVMESSQLGLAQDIAALLKPLPVVLIVLSLALAGAAIAVAPGWRRRALRAYGFGFIAAGAAALLTRSLAGDMVVDSLARTAAGEPAVREVWTISTSLLVDIAAAAVVYGAIIVVAAWLAGATRVAIAVRRAITPYLREPAIAYSVLAVVVAGVVWWAPTPAWRSPVMLAILVALLAAGVEALRRQVIREFPAATRDEAVRRRRERRQALTAAAKERGSELRSSLAQGMKAASGGVAASRESLRAHPASPEDDRLERLERLARLQQAGILDADELQAEKQRLLAS